MSCFARLALIGLPSRQRFRPRADLSRINRAQLDQKCSKILRETVQRLNVGEQLVLGLVSWGR